MPHTPQPVYAPILGIAVSIHAGVFDRVSSIEELDTNVNAYIPIGAAEDGSKLELTPLFVTKGSTQRYIRTNVKITYLDMEARKNPTIEPFAGVPFYQQYQNKNVHADLLCGSGMITLINLTYAFYAEHLPNRGMRWIHQFTGNCIQPEFITFLDAGWNDYIAKVRGRSSAIVTNGNVFEV